MNHECERCCECHDEDPFNGRTYLYIRRHPDDYGLEPLPVGLPGYISPAISIITPDGVRATEVVPDGKYEIEVVVTNSGGIIATDAFVEVFFSGPTTAFIPIIANKIGHAFVTVQAHSTASVRIPWRPLPSQSGHLCLTARVSLIAPPDTFKDPNTFDVYQDRHIAQRNINVINLKGEQDFSFDFDLVNPLPLENTGELILQTRFANVDEMEDTINQALGCCFSHFSNSSFGEISLEIDENKQELDEEGRCGVYIPDNVVKKARLIVKGLKEDSNPCKLLHLLEVKLIQPELQNDSDETMHDHSIGGLWVIINP
ncbi:hypothetical protein [Priestia megaterium]|uniref:hypothetical protein n=1 Tax=Priestia megaterium TaxID=1404 RepID=UPI00234E5877|nr:hypothetical protein [Priestia megaterium]MDC7783210.1 hypothetical protein [Priestia megaterium]